jgi:putative MATE family efflux protein
MAVGLGMWFLGDWALGILGAEPGAREEGVVYIRAAAVGLPLMSLLLVGSASLQGAGDTRTPMAVGVIVNIVNLVVAVLLINGLGPFPRLEVLGSGAGYTSAAIVGSTLVLSVLTFGSPIIRWAPWKALDLNWAESRRILNVGVPGGLEQMQFMLAFLLYTRIIASLGTSALAAHGIMLAVQSFTFHIGFSLGIAASALVGQSLGAGRPDLAERAAHIATRFAVAIMIALAATLMILGGPITGVFVGGPDADEVIDIGRRLFLIFGFAMPAMGVSLTLGGGLRGAGDTRAVLAIMVGTTWGLRLGPAYLLAITAGLGVPGAWAAAVIDINVRALLMWRRFRRGRWKRIRL